MHRCCVAGAISLSCIVFSEITHQFTVGVDRGSLDTSRCESHSPESEYVLFATAARRFRPYPSAEASLRTLSPGQSTSADPGRRAANGADPHPTLGPTLTHDLLWQTLKSRYSKGETQAKVENALALKAVRFVLYLKEKTMWHIHLCLRTANTKPHFKGQTHLLVRRPVLDAMAASP